MQLCNFFCIVALAGCASSNLDPNADERLFQRDPDLWWHLREQAVPQDDRLHWSNTVSQVRDRQTGAAIGWEFDVAVKYAWPRREPPAPAIKRPRVPAKTYPPDR
jgi:hypothetical protein